MIGFNPLWGGNDVIQDSPPYDGLAISFLPSIVNDALAGVPEADSAESVHSFMQSRFRATAENMYDAGLVISQQV